MSNSPLRSYPAGWTSTTIGEVCQLVAGVGFPEHLQRVTDAEIPVFKVGDISRAWQDGQITLNESPNTVTAAVARSLTSKLVPPSTVVFAKIGAAIALNRRAITGRPCLIDNNVMGLVPQDGVNSRLLFYFLCTQNLQEYARATTVPSIRKGDVADIPFALPPTAEQGRLVDAIDSHLTRLDDSVASLKRVQAKLKAYRASVLKAAVEGRLVPTEASLARAEKRAYESAEVLLARILKERRRRWNEAGLAKIKAAGKVPKDDKWKARYLEPGAPNTSKLAEIPEGWCWATVDMLAEVKGGITKGQKRRPKQVLRDVPYLRVANVQRGYLDLSEVKTIQATPDEIAELRLEPGDVLFNEGGDRDKLGRGWIWRGEIETCIHQNHVFRVRILTEDLQPRLLSWYGNSSGQRYFFDEGKQTTNLASVNMTKLKLLPVPIPPKREQTRIADEVERMLSVADEVAVAIAHDVKRCARLRQAVLKWAFEGKLVDQDPTDELADKLLARIRAARASTAPMNTRKASTVKGAA